MLFEQFTWKVPNLLGRFWQRIVYFKNPFQDEMEKTLASMRVGNEDIHIKSLKDSNNKLLNKRMKKDQKWVIELAKLQLLLQSLLLRVYVFNFLLSVLSVQMGLSVCFL